VKELGLSTIGGQGKPTVGLEGLGQQGSDTWHHAIAAGWQHTNANFKPENYQIHHAFKVYNPAEVEQKWEKIKDSDASTGRGNATQAYHGTDFVAASSIIKTGYRVMKKTSSGGAVWRAVGNGLYTAPSASKSVQYLNRGDGFSRNGHGTLFVNRVLYGNVASEFDNSQKRLDADSVYVGGKQTGGGSASRFEYAEYVTKDPARIIPAYWLDIGRK